MLEFNRIKRLPPYVFAIVNGLKMEARKRGEDIIDLGMGNPDMPAPKHVIDKLCEAANNPKNHRYSASKGITQLRMAVCEWYKRRFDVDLDPESEAVVTIGSKEGLSHLALAIIQPGDVVMTPTPAYPIHPYSVIIAGGEVTSIPIGPGIDFFAEMEKTFKKTWPRPKMLIINFPHNPTTIVVEGLEFFKKVVDFAKENKIIVLHDFAYADLVFDDYKAPSFLQVPGAKDVGVEFFSLTKSYSMAGWRVGFCIGNKDIVGALIKIKSYLDYGMFQPIQIAGIVALRGPQDCVEEFRKTYESRRNALINGLHNAGWNVEPPKATMFVWAKIPERFRKMGSLEFTKLLIKEGGVAASPGIGFGEGGDEYVRFALVENEHRIKQAAKGIKKVLGR
ncbi:MAG: alanine transaminase [Nitrospirae bacterium CG_4_10_14_3_um_filter_44_29]|nr:aminotransferase class I/II-fold pyridoxal phosphate-dependent enzyme [Nitrospirota bacterium]PIP69441.1 MAG: alanine transaminase [Nitrospirae bacterium CG22_combo_CG10-13_8_21_14_all_44_11]PIV40203.1 MAG: alanine transaminase [Nitrospirae bacterium CG02_land_8_20_14_3_00_44_33]PIV66234.1 MAG: alanine transaminase [Nitrospirae bacterium CG01_land_8_20_14_3_00_44_22]PIW89395.1 MAG: alanine transaminase [Nitrospirae bacterium CG_4_8_14_3_um_filter_44_28]PIX89177.1 MAG: alanine transaminase [